MNKSGNLEIFSAHKVRQSKRRIIPVINQAPRREDA
jgi:hypothetical protein